MLNKCDILVRPIRDTDTRRMNSRCSALFKQYYSMEMKAMKAGRVILLFTGFRWGCAFIQVKKARDQHSMIGIAQLCERKESHIWQ